MLAELAPILGPIAAVVALVAGFVLLVWLVLKGHRGFEAAAGVEPGG